MTKFYSPRFLGGCLAILLIVFSSSLFAQSKIEGTVFDATDGSVLPGVSVIVKGTTQGASTDVNGQFKLDAVPTDATLVFSFIGFANQEVPVGNTTNFRIQLVEDNAYLNEVVVIGYGTQAKVSLTGAVGVIESKKIENRPLTNLASGLQGLSPGLVVTRGTGQPGNEGYNITIRGATTANGSVPPLVILDGITAPSSVLTTLNPSDIESISVLKDAAAASIYGAQAAGGVILINTKKGRDQKLQVNFTALIGATKVINMPKRMTLLNEALFNNIAFTNAGSSAQYSDLDLENIRNNVPYIVNPNDTTKYIYYNQVSPEEILLKKYGSNQNYNLSLRGGTAKLNYFLSGGAFFQKGVLKYGNDETSRYNARLNLGTEINKYISLDTRLNYSDQYNKAPYLSASGDYGVIYQISRLRQRNPLLTPEGQYNQDSPTLGILKEGGYNNNKRNEYGAIGTFKVANFLEGLSLRAIFGIQYQTDQGIQFGRTVPLWGKTGITGYYNQNNSLNESVVSRKTVNVQYLANYDRTFAEKHALSVLAGYQYEDFRYEGLFAGASNLISNDLPVLNLGNTLTKTNSQSIFANAYQSFFTRLNYTFNRKYIAEFTYRVDENSKLAPGLRKKGFFSVSGAWNLNEENWFNDAMPFFSEFKLRGSWGQLGGALGSGIGYYDYANILARGTSLVLGNSQTTYFYQGSIPSSTLSWETIETTDFGIDLGFFNQRLTFTGDYYIKYNRNMLTPTQLPATLGVNSPLKNNGELKSWGWETQLSYNGRAGENFNFNFGFNLSDNQNKLLKYSGYQVVGAGRNSLIEGQALNSIFGYKTDGYYQTPDEVKAGPTYSSKTGVGDVKYVDLDGDGKLSVGKGLISSKGDLVYLGTDAPRFNYGINLGASFHGFDLSIFFQGVAKRVFIPGYNSLAPLSESWRQPLVYHSDYWTPENPNALYPRPFYQGSHNYAASDKWTLNAAYMRLKNLQFGYSIPTKILSKAKIDNLRVFLSGQDLWTISKMGVLGTIFDPESNNGVVNDYPFSGTLSFGLNLNF